MSRDSCCRRTFRDWLPADHLAWFVIDAVAQMDLGAFYAAYRADGHGRAAYEPSLMGWIQLVVATPDVEELRCPEETVLWIVPLQPERVGVDIRRRGDGSIGFGSGRRSLEVHQAKRLRSRRVCCRALVSGGFARVAGCRLSISRRCRGAICRSAEREEIAVLLAGGSGVREIARQLESCAVDDLARVATQRCDRTWPR